MPFAMSTVTIVPAASPSTPIVPVAGTAKRAVLRTMNLVATLLSHAYLYHFMLFSYGTLTGTSTSAIVRLGFMYTMLGSVLYRQDADGSSAWTVMHMLLATAGIAVALVDNMVRASGSARGLVGLVAERAWTAPQMV
jgi:hypothetical protein